LSYPENRKKSNNTLLKAITLDLTVGFLISLVFSKLDIQIFPGTPRSTRSNFRKAFKYVSKVKLG